MSGRQEGTKEVTFAVLGANGGSQKKKRPKYSVTEEWRYCINVLSTVKFHSLQLPDGALT